MPTNRKRRTRNIAPGLTAEAIDAFQAVDRQLLHRALGLKLWDVSPLEVSPGEECPYPPGSGGALDWHRITEIRRALDDAVRGMGGLGLPDLDHAT